MNDREFLFGLEQFGMKLGFENITHLLAAAGNPHLHLHAVHVAGTNGKGSVLALLDAMLRAAGYSTGRYTSPHLIRVNERFLLDGRLISDADLDEGLRFFRPVAEAMEPPPTFFEFVTAVAFRWFSAKQVDLALVEVGMGGRLDSTTVVRPEVTAITNIDLEHTQHLGATRAAIAFEKAGILKPGVPLVLGESREEPYEVIAARAAELEVPVRLLGRDFQFTLHGDPFDQALDYAGPTFRLSTAPLGLCGGYQGENAALAVALAEELAGRYPRLDEPAVRQGLREARWPCRLERVLDRPMVVIDAAHNEAGARRLAAQLEPCVVVLAVASDKDARGIIEALAPKATELILTRFTGRRGLPVEALERAAEGHAYRSAPDLPAALEMAVELAGGTAPILVTGSIFTAGEARQCLMGRFGASPPEF